MSYTRKILVGLIAFASTFTSKAGNELYGIRNYARHYEFVKIDCSNDSLTVLNQLPNFYFTPNFSSCYDNLNHKYYLCFGQQMQVLDAISGNLDTTFNFTTINPRYLEHIVFNSSDGFIYGISEDHATFLQTLFKFNPANAQLTNLFAIVPQVGVGVGCKAAIDPYLGQYYIQSRSLSTINIYSGQVVNNLPLQNPTNEWLDHFAYSCKQNRFFGLTNNYHTTENYFSEIDSTTGITSRVNPSPLSTYFYKQYLSGSSIDNSTDIFYYAALSKIYGIDITTGAVVYSHDYGSDYQFLFLESGTSFDCLTADVHELNKENISVFPNPSNGIFTFNFKNINSKQLILEIYNLSGQLLKTEVVTREKSFELDLSSSENGIYFYKLKGEDSVVMGKLVKVE